MKHIKDSVYTDEEVTQIIKTSDLLCEFFDMNGISRNDSVLGMAFLICKIAEPLNEEEMDFFMNSMKNQWRAIKNEQSWVWIKADAR